MTAFVPDAEFIVFESDHWRVNQRVDSLLPGYLVVGARTGSSWSLLSASALLELGPVLSAAVRTLQKCLSPEHVHVCSFGHDSGHSLHFHVIPIYEWVKEMYFQAVTDGGTEVVYPDFADGASLTLFVSEEFSRGRSLCKVPGPSVREIIQELSSAFAQVRVGRPLKQ